MRIYASVDVRTQHCCTVHPLYRVLPQSCIWHWCPCNGAVLQLDYGIFRGKVVVVIFIQRKSAEKSHKAITKQEDSPEGSVTASNGSFCL